VSPLVVLAQPRFIGIGAADGSEGDQVPLATIGERVRGRAPVESLGDRQARVGVADRLERVQGVHRAPSITVAASIVK
jgi:hypothetical protein